MRPHGPKITVDGVRAPSREDLHRLFHATGGLHDDDVESPPSRGTVDEPLTRADALDEEIDATLRRGHR